MTKCIGCGIESEKELCNRCFKIKHYNEYEEVEIKANEFIEIIDNINENELVLLVVDVMDIPKNFDIFRKLKNVLLVITKKDILPSSIKDHKVLYHMDNYKFNFTDKIIVSSNKNYNFDELMDKINLYKKSNNVYIIGYTNSGKSTLINKIIYNYSENKRELTTSMLPSTTLDLINVSINDDLTLIDTPGIIDGSSISFHLDKKILKKIIQKKPIRPVTYQIKFRQAIKIEDFLIAEFLTENSITFYLSNNLDSERLYEKVNTDLIKKELTVEYGSDIVIKGLGFINVKKRAIINIYVKEGIEVFVRNSVI